MRTAIKLASGIAAALTSGTALAALLAALALAPWVWAAACIAVTGASLAGDPCNQGCISDPQGLMV
jgi:hypothetical protein